MTQKEILKWAKRGLYAEYDIACNSFEKGAWNSDEGRAKIEELGKKVDEIQALLFAEIEKEA